MLKIRKHGPAAEPVVTVPFPSAAESGADFQAVFDTDGPALARWLYTTVPVGTLGVALAELRRLESGASSVHLPDAPREDLA